MRKIKITQKVFSGSDANEAYIFQEGENLSKTDVPYFMQSSLPDEPRCKAILWNGQGEIVEIQLNGGVTLYFKGGQFSLIDISKQSDVPF